MAYSKQNFQDGQILTAANLEKMENGIIAGQGVRNLLVNSNFRNPINSKGKSSYSTAGNEYTIDKWKTQYGTGLTIENGYINVIGGWQIYQAIKNPKDGVYTFAVEARINSIGDHTPNMDIGGKIETSFGTNIGEWKIHILQYDLSTITDETISLSIAARGGNSSGSISVRWAALYKGSYTIDTLPDYIPKPIQQEMLDCGVPLYPYNLLDNSDFRIKENIINTKGLSKYEFDDGPVMDRWRLHWSGWDCKLEIKDGYIELYRPSHSIYLFQHPRNLQSMIGKTYTVAAKMRYNGYIGWIDSTQRVNCGKQALNDWSIITHTFTVGSATSDFGEAGIEIGTTSNLSLEVQWVALYEGAYTSSTLPPYVPKGKHVEMLNCSVPLAPHNLLDNSDFRNPVNQRGQSSYTGIAYSIDRWRSWDSNNTTTLNDGNISVSVHSVQKVPKNQFKSGNTYTFALCASDGTIYVNSGIYTPGGEGFGDWTHTWVELPADGNVTIYIRNGTYVWAALYEGSYDASTLPAYVPKGYAAELAECQRYYWRYWQNNNFDIGHGYMNTTDTANITFDFPTKMRIAPTITIGDISTLRVMCVNGLKGTTASSVVKTTDKQMMVGFTLDSTSTQFTPCVMRSNSGTTIEFSADL